MPERGREEEGGHLSVYGTETEQNERDGAGLRCSVAAATPSQQRLRRSSVAAALRAVSAPSQQHQLHRSSISSVADATRRMSATELPLRSSVAAVGPSQQHQLRRSSISSIAAAAAAGNGSSVPRR